MSNSMFDLLNKERLWRYLRFGSYIIGVSCFPFGVYWKDHLVASCFLIIMTLASGVFIYSELSSISILNKLASFFLGMALITGVGGPSDEEGKPEMGYKRILGLISSGAFTVTSLSLWRQIALELEQLGILGFPSNAISSLTNNPNFWRLLGSGSSIVGFSCCALSPTFKNMIGEWNWWKIAIYITVFCSCLFMLCFVKELGSRENFMSKANACFLVFLGNCVYSYYQDKIEGRNESEHGRMLSMFSFGGFAFMSLSLSRLINIGFDMGVSTFFLTGFSTWAMKMNLLVKIAAALICYVFFYIWSY